MTHRDTRYERQIPGLHSQPPLPPPKDCVAYQQWRTMQPWKDEWMMKAKGEGETEKREEANISNSLLHISRLVPRVVPFPCSLHRHTPSFMPVRRVSLAHTAAQRQSQSTTSACDADTALLASGALATSDSSWHVCVRVSVCQTPTA